MPWLKKQQPIQLYQSSELPYIILEDGVHLCFDNCYGVKPDKSEFNIHFRVAARNLRRINTFFFRFAHFPFIVPFSDVVSLDDAIVEGRTIKHASITSESKSVAIIKSSYIRSISDSKLSIFSDSLEEYDKSFILTEETIDPQVRLLEDISTIVSHKNWYRTAAELSHRLSGANHRKYCWTKSVPELNLSCYGVDDSEELQHINDAFNRVGIPGFSTEWRD